MLHIVLTVFFSKTPQPNQKVCPWFLANASFYRNGQSDLPHYQSANKAATYISSLLNMTDTVLAANVKLHLQAVQCSNE